MEIVELRTARTVLSVPSDGDVQAVFAACQDADIQRFTTVPSPYLREHAEGFVAQSRQRWADDVEATWAIRTGGELAGMIGLHGLAGGAPQIGYWMTRDHRGRGLLTEAAHVVLDWGFSPRAANAARIGWQAVVGNRASARVAQALGFRYEGTLRQALANSLGRDDGWIAGLLPSDDRTPQPWPVFED